MKSAPSRKAMSRQKSVLNSPMMRTVRYRQTHDSTPSQGRLFGEPEDLADLPSINSRSPHLSRTESFRQPLLPPSQLGDRPVPIPLKERLSITTLQAMDRFVAYYDAMKPLRRIMRVLGLWQPPMSHWLWVKVYPWAVIVLILFPWAYFFLHFHKQVNGGDKFLVVFALVHVLYLFCFAYARKYFKTSHFVELIISIFQTGSYVHEQVSENLGGQVNVATRLAHVREFKQLVKATKKTFYTQVLFSQICYLVFMIDDVRSSVNADIRIRDSMWDIFEFVSISFSTAQYALICMFAKLIFKLHRWDVIRHVACFRIYQHVKETEEAVPPNYHPPTEEDMAKQHHTPLTRPHSDSVRSHTSRAVLMKEETVHFDALDKLSLEQLDVRWTELGLELANENLPLHVADFIRMNRDMRDTSRHFRLFLSVSFFLSFLGGILSAWVLLASDTDRSLKTISIYAPSFFNLMFSILVMAGAAKVAHSANNIARTMSEYAAWLSFTLGRLRPLTTEYVAAAQQRAQAVVLLVSNRRIYLSLYGLALDRSLAFGVLSPLVALTLFLVQQFIVAEGG